MRYRVLREFTDAQGRLRREGDVLSLPRYYALQLMRRKTVAPVPPQKPRVTMRWVNGNLQLRDEHRRLIAELDGENRAWRVVDGADLSLPQGSLATEYYGDGSVTTEKFGMTAAPSARVLDDPGHDEPLPVVSNGLLLITCAEDADEVNTLPDPAAPGLEIMIVLQETSGTGNRVVTADNPINDAGNTTITLDTEGDNAILRGVIIDGDLRWRVIHSDGATLG